jgi:hypothetical protein
VRAKAPARVYGKKARSLQNTIKARPKGKRKSISSVHAEEAERWRFFQWYSIVSSHSLCSCFTRLNAFYRNCDCWEKYVNFFSFQNLFLEGLLCWKLVRIQGKFCRRSRVFTVGRNSFFSFSVF